MKRKTTLKISSLFAFLLATTALQAQNVGIGTSTPLEKLHVAGNVRVDPLAGVAERVTIANPQGTLQVVPVGAVGEILTQQLSGPQWEPLPNISTSSVSNCTTPPCPTQLSTTAVTTMTWGDCSRYCENLVESGFSDWRMPMLEEMKYLYGGTTSEVVNIWLSSQSPSNDIRWLIIRMDNGNVSAANGSTLLDCKCVR